MTNPNSILVYVRPWNLSQMAHLARGIWGEDASLSITSEHHTVDQSGLVATFNAAHSQARVDAPLRHLSEEEAADITLRCRLLRSIGKVRARHLLWAMEHAVDQVLTETKPSAMLSLTVDSYVMDIFAALCAKRGIRFIGLVPSFINEHFRISTRGEHNDSRVVSDADIDAALSTLIVKDYRPDFLVQTDTEMRRQMWRLWMRNLPKPLWFALRRMKPANRLNYHYWASQIIAAQYWALWPRMPKGISGPALKAVAEDDGLPRIYLPLQMSPEATIDYWSSDTRWIDYEQHVLDLIQRYRVKWRFFVKEHPNLLGYRSRGFYKRLEAEPNCIMVAPSVPSNDLVTLCQGVLVCTGTAGFEAALRGKPVLSDSEPYYAPPGTLLPIETLTEDLPDQIAVRERQNLLAGHVLRGTLSGRFLNNGKWCADNPTHSGWSDTMAASIRSYLDYADTQYTATPKTMSDR
ncbi:capsular biosynthesis protein [Rhodobacteraceae bacterium M385]|nr:capsular biosynthesis protein [Rhodobacteraceae bacterium M385]